MVKKASKAGVYKGTYYKVGYSKANVSSGLRRLPGVAFTPPKKSSTAAFQRVKRVL